MMMSPTGNIFWVTGPEFGNSPVTGEFPSQSPAMWSFDVSFDLCLNKQLNKQSWAWWFDTPSRPLWSHCNVPVEFALTWMPLKLIDFKSALFRVMAWCHQTSSHYLHIKFDQALWQHMVLPGSKELIDTIWSMYGKSINHKHCCGIQ